MGIGSEVDPSEQRSLFPNGGQFLFLWRSSHENGSIVTEDPGEDLSEVSGGFNYRKGLLP